MLEDECRLPRGSDKKWVGRLYKQYLKAGEPEESGEESTAGGRFSANAKQVLREEQGRAPYRSLGVVRSRRE